MEKSIMKVRKIITLMAFLLLGTGMAYGDINVLIQIIRNGKSDKLKELIERQNIDFSQQGKNGEKILLLAFQSSREMFKTILKSKKFNPEKSEQYLQEELKRKKIRSGVTQNIELRERESLLELAIESGKELDESLKKYNEMRARKSILERAFGYLEAAKKNCLMKESEERKLEELIAMELNESSILEKISNARNNVRDLQKVTNRNTAFFNVNIKKIREKVGFNKWTDYFMEEGRISDEIEGISEEMKKLEKNFKYFVEVKTTPLIQKFAVSDRVRKLVEDIEFLGYMLGMVRCEIQDRNITRKKAVLSYETSEMTKIRCNEIRSKKKIVKKLQQELKEVLKGFSRFER